MKCSHELTQLRCSSHARRPHQINAMKQSVSRPRGSSLRSGIFSDCQWRLLADSLDLTQREFEVVKFVFDDDKESNIARRLGISDRGLIQVGLAADIAVFDPETIADRSTFTDPTVYAVGVKHVLVNGVLVIDGGEHTGARPGKVIYGPGRK